MAFTNYLGIFHGVVALLLATTALFAFQWWLRVIFFGRGEWSWDRKKQPWENARHHEDIVISPVDGTVVYVKDTAVERYVSRKLGTPVGIDWTEGNDGIIIGVYMSIFDRHFVISPIEDFISIQSHNPVKETSIPMMDLLEYFHFYYLGRFAKRFAEKADKYARLNETMVWKYNCGMRLLLIGDKYVNKIEPDEGKVTWFGSTMPVLRAEKLGAIRRGSQVDIFIPKHLCHSVMVRVGQKLQLGDELCRLNFPEY